MDIILDKSFLDGCSISMMRDLCEKHRLMMPDTLFYELITTKNESRQRCFSKIPAGDNPLVLIPNIGTLLRYENDNRKPSVPVYQHRIKFDYSFNSKLAAGEFEFSQDLQEERHRSILEIKGEANAFMERASTMRDMFSSLRDCEKKNIETVVSSLKNEVARNPWLVKEVYAGTIGDANLPIDVKPENIGKNWAIYRWIQVQLIYALDLYKKYQGEIPPPNSGKSFMLNIEHDMLDSQYVMLATLVGGLACRDTKIIEVFKALHPKGVVLS